MLVSPFINGILEREMKQCLMCSVCKVFGGGVGGGSGWVAGVVAGGWELSSFAAYITSRCYLHP